MKIKRLFLGICLIVMPIKSSDHLHFLRKVSALAAGVWVAYKAIDKSRAEDIVKRLHKEFNTKIDLAFHTKLSNKNKYDKGVSFPAYALRGVAGLITFKLIDFLLNHE
ncbi:MAG: hypothetical protein P4L22_07300 [Candidatus Babeliales bacterium]|nr:hypothetical protein [Candidatus Babeliales bacterium]